MAQADLIEVELVYINPEQQFLNKIKIPVGSTIRQAIDQSDVLSRFEEINLEKNKVGVFSKTQSLDYVLKEGDRVEIYRPLIVDPKEARRQRASNKDK